MSAMMSLSWKSFGRVDGRDAEGLERLGVLGRDDAADDDGHVVEPFLAHALHDVLDERHVRARQDRQTDDVDASSTAARTICAGRQADALVDDLHAGIAGAHGDLLGAVRMAVEARLADQKLDAPAELVGHGFD